MIQVGHLLGLLENLRIREKRRILTKFCEFQPNVSFLTKLQNFPIFRIQPNQNVKFNHTKPAGPTNLPDLPTFQTYLSIWPTLLPDLPDPFLTHYLSQKHCFYQIKPLPTMISDTLVTGITYLKYIFYNSDSKYQGSFAILETLGISLLYHEAFSFHFSFSISRHFHLTFLFSLLELPISTLETLQTFD